MLESTDRRIERVTNALLPTTPFSGAYAPPQPLHERMAHYHTPGVSIAVIDDFELAWAQGFGVCK